MQRNRCYQLEEVLDICLYIKRTGGFENVTLTWLIGGKTEKQHQIAGLDYTNKQSDNTKKKAGSEVVSINESIKKRLWSTWLTKL